MFQFGEKSKRELDGVHPALVAVAIRALELSFEKYKIDFGISQGARTVEQQKEKVKAGASASMNSRHIPENNESGLACAIDVVAIIGGTANWEFWVYKKIASCFYQAAIEKGVQIEWGGLWRKPQDGPHFQLSWRYYP